MERCGLIIACAAAVFGSASAQAQTAIAPVAGAVADQQPRVPDAATPAEGAEVPVTRETPAPVTAPGAGLDETVPLTPVDQIPPQPAPAPRGAFEADPDAYSIISAGSGLSLHKPMYLLPYTYTPNEHGKNTEVLFTISLKQRLFGIPLYFAYSQKSFWLAYNDKRSSPFRENDYNPELFYRFIPADRERWLHLGADVGFEHESNGRGLPDSRSWNRIYLALFQAQGGHLVYWKWWWRLPEDKSKPPTDPDRDDNPDIGSYYGYSELTYAQQLFDKHLARFTFRFNPATGHGAVNFQYTIPNRSSNPSFFWMFYLFQGYGEDLFNYNRSVFRVGIGAAVAR